MYWTNVDLVDLHRAQRSTLVPGIVLIAGRGDMRDVLDVLVRAAAICQQQGQK